MHGDSNEHAGLQPTLVGTKRASLFSALIVAASLSLRETRISQRAVRHGAPPFVFSRCLTSVTDLRSQASVEASPARSVPPAHSRQALGPAAMYQRRSPFTVSPCTYPVA